jgi:hypothetical protein
MDDQGTNRAGGGSVATCSRTTAIALIVIGLIALPFILVTLAILENRIFSTSYIFEIFEAIGIFEPLNELYRKFPWMGN